MPEDDPQQVLTVTEVARLLKVHRRTVLSLLKQPNGLIGFQIGREWRVQRAKLMEYVARVEAQRHQRSD